MPVYSTSCRGCAGPTTLSISSTQKYGNENTARRVSQESARFPSAPKVAGNTTCTSTSSVGGPLMELVLRLFFLENTQNTAMHVQRHQRFITGKRMRNDNIF